MFDPLAGPAAAFAAAARNAAAAVADTPHAAVLAAVAVFAAIVGGVAFVTIRAYIERLRYMPKLGGDDA